MTPDRFALVPSSYVFLLRGGARDGEVLLQRRQNTGFMDGYWAASAAGHVEPGEACTTTVVREVREEIGIAVAVGDLEPLCAVHRHQQSDRPVDQRVDFFYACRRWSGDPALQETKASELQWFDLRALPDPVVPHELTVLSGLIAGSLPPAFPFGF
jgi:8-oxo-dGTP pyrophosphatase MutT (NUDIX family)